ncbi:hypothetical protein QCA50_005886 [Cerrena zonata]|uniref:Uncharacterized protein n=1 Tax=Cerrena zonata TaxID=2478898 RepID=A0AAW0GBP1_9APHY
MSDELGLTSDEAIVLISQLHIQNVIVTIALMGVIIRTVFVAADALVLGLTLWKTIYIFKEDAQVRANSKLTTTLAYGGSIQFSVLLILNILAALLDVLAIAGDGSIASYSSSFIYIQQVLTPIILSHFILSLHSIYHTSNNSTQSTSKQSSLQFASAIEGNMGASLSASSREEHEEEMEDIQYSDYPFSTGLAKSKEIDVSESVGETPEAGPSGITHDFEPSSSHIEGIEEFELQEIV